MYAPRALGGVGDGVADTYGKYVGQRSKSPTE
eukprot:SAG31_NODE_39513_length_287_cov_1.372340_1_plen_31_part_10